MAYQIRFEVGAKKDFKKIDNSIKIKIIKFLKKLESREDPRTLGESLEENLSGYWKYRVGDYRLVVEILDDVLTILMLVVSKRDTVYKIADTRLNRMRY